MKICIASKRFYPPYGGATISLINIARQLSLKNKVFIYYEDTLNEQPTNEFEHTILDVDITNPIIRGYVLKEYLQAKRWKSKINEQFNKIHFDLLVTQMFYSAPSILAAKKNNIPSILLIRSFEYFILFGNPLISNYSSIFKYYILNWKDMLQIPFAYSLYYMMRKAFMNATAVVANSQFIASKCIEFYGRSPEVIYPSGFNEVIINSKNNINEQYITLITPLRNKGLDIFIEIARRLPQFNFLAIGRTDENSIEKLKAIKNIKYVNWIKDKKEIYKQTNILLVPSLMDEAFGRVCVEALLNGIPCVASKKGGIPEAVGEGGVLIDDPYNIDKWIKSILKIVSDSQFRDQLIVKGKNHVQKFTDGSSLKKFEQLLEKSVLHF